MIQLVSTKATSAADHSGQDWRDSFHHLNAEMQISNSCPAFIKGLIYFFFFVVVVSIRESSMSTKTSPNELTKAAKHELTKLLGSCNPYPCL